MDEATIAEEREPVEEREDALFAFLAEMPFVERLEAIDRMAKKLGV